MRLKMFMKAISQHTYRGLVMNTMEKKSFQKPTKKVWKCFHKIRTKHMMKVNYIFNIVSKLLSFLLQKIIEYNVWKEMFFLVIPPENRKLVLTLIFLIDLFFTIFSLTYLKQYKKRIFMNCWFADKLHINVNL